MRLLGLFLFLAVIGAASFVYNVKYRTSGFVREASALEAQITHEQNTIATLRAEWSALNQPARLQALAQRHLPEFRNIAVTQIALAYELPERPLDLGKFIDTLDAQKGLETPIDKKLIPAAMASSPKAGPTAVRQPDLSSVRVVRAPVKPKTTPSPMPLIPSSLY